MSWSLVAIHLAIDTSGGISFQVQKIELRRRSEEHHGEGPAHRDRYQAHDAVWIGLEHWQILSQLWQDMPISIRALLIGQRNKLGLARDVIEAPCLPVGAGLFNPIF